MGKRFRHTVLTLFFAVLMALPLKAWASQAAPPFRVDFIDVGQGDASLIKCDGHFMLIDGGKSERSDFIYSYLKGQGAAHLDYMVATHPDEDHIGGLSGALNFATTDHAFFPVTANEAKTFANFVKYLDKQGKGITVPKAGDSYSLGSSQISVLGPIRSSTDNNNSIVLKVVYGKTSFLFMGDAEEEEESDILSSGRGVKCDVLRVGHHGSSSSTSSRFLRESSPKYAVISVGDGNSYGHPTEQTLSRLRDVGAKTYRTDMQGHIICTSDGMNLSFSPQKNAEADTLSKAGAGTGQKPTESGVSDTKGATQGGDAAAADLPAQNGTKATQGGETSRSITYILNTNTKKFHYPTCSSVSKMKEKNKRMFEGTRDEAIASGYSPCGNCHP